MQTTWIKKCSLSAMLFPVVFIMYRVGLEPIGAMPSLCTVSIDTSDAEGEFAIFL